MSQLYEHIPARLVRVYARGLLQCLRVRACVFQGQLSEAESEGSLANWRRYCASLEISMATHREADIGALQLSLGPDINEHLKLHALAGLEGVKHVGDGCLVRHARLHHSTR